MITSEANDQAIQAGGVDWVAHWREVALAREAMTQAASGAAPGANRWDQRAGRFARLTAELDAGADPLIRAVRVALRPEDTVLDAGAGAGRYTIPLAASARHVTAVEPSGGMRASLASAVEARGLQNVTIVPGTWQEAEVEPHDVVLCSHVLYFVPDAVPFIEKLDRHARRACYIYLRVDPREKPLLPLWRELLGQVRPPEPGFLDLYNLLFSLGIRAQVQIPPPERGTRFENLDDAVAQARDMLGLAPDDHQHDARIRSYLADRLQPAGAGLAFLPYLQTAIVWWEKG